jgi:hypothetical protein
MYIILSILMFVINVCISWVLVNIIRKNPKLESSKKRTLIVFSIIAPPLVLLLWRKELFK